MSAADLAFYLLAALVLGATVAAVTRESAVHAVVWLMVSFLGTAGLFGLLGAPVLAGLQIVLYAGGILVLFLFVVLGLHAHRGGRWRGPLRPVGSLRRWGLGAALAAGGALAGRFVLADPAAGRRLAGAGGAARDFGALLFGRYALPVEVVSLALFVALVGALVLGRAPGRGAPGSEGP